MAAPSVGVTPPVAPGGPSAPQVSVLTATYNRSNVLALAVESVLRQTLASWELWVIGDACTDDTAEVVAGFADPRIRFVNLDRHAGEQSGPHNEGFRWARGRYIAYLNHDDLWLADHLETAVAALEQTGADLVFTLVDQVLPGGRTRVLGATPTGRFEPYIYVPVSAWVLRRELLEEIGPWRSARECYEGPSENLMFRAWRAGKDMRLVPRLTVVMLPSGLREGPYAQREVAEHHGYRDRMREPAFREHELTMLVWQHAASEWRPVVWKSAFRNTVRRALAAVGVHPMRVRRFLQYRRKGGFIDHLRRRHGLPPLPEGRGRP